MHAASILHRDISPDNLLIDKNGRVILIDFGAARQSMGEMSKSLSVIMKAGYSPPEQYQSRGKQGPWTDIYAVAASFYRAITGKAPLEAIDRMAKDDLIPPSMFGIYININLEKALLKALSFKAEERYQSVLNFLEAFTGKEKSDRTTEKTRVVNQKKEIELDSKNRKPELEFEQVVKKKPQVKTFPLLKQIVLMAIGVVLVGLLISTGSSLFSENMSDKGQANFDGALEEKVIESVAEESDTLVAVQELRDNSIGNIINVGIAAAEGDWVYYRRAEADGAIFKTRIDGTEHLMVVNDDAWNINVQDGWLYYSNRDENWNVYKVRTDGSGRNKINSDDSGNLQLVDGWLYNRNDYEDGLIYKARTDGSENTKINSDDSWNINVADEWIYYSTPDEGWNGQ